MCAWSWRSRAVCYSLSAICQVWKTLSSGRLVDAIGGMETAVEAFQAVIDGTYPGKVVIFQQIHNLPLTGLKDLHKVLPEVAEKLGDDNMWTNEAEEAVIELLWQKPE